MAHENGDWCCCAALNDGLSCEDTDACYDAHHGSDGLAGPDGPCWDDVTWWMENHGIGRVAAMELVIGESLVRLFRERRAVTELAAQNLDTAIQSRPGRDRDTRAYNEVETALLGSLNGAASAYLEAATQ